jgi:Fe2+ or Zn2+ uptake regulation protein
MEQYKKLVRKFKEHGYKMTPQRRAILRAIVKGGSHPCAEEIYEIVLEEMPDTSRATVYNTLRELVAIHEACELDLDHHVRRYELSAQEHGHLVCLQCERIEDIVCNFGQIRAAFEHENGFVPVRYTATIYGYCSTCKSEQHGF